MRNEKFAVRVKADTWAWEGRHIGLSIIARKGKIN